MLVARSTAMRTALETSKASRDVATTLRAYDNINRTAQRRRRRSDALPRGRADRGAAANAGEKCEVRMASEQHQAVAVAPDLRAAEGDRRRAGGCADQALPDAHARRLRARRHRARRRRPRQGAGAGRRDFRSSAPNSNANIPKGQRTITVDRRRARRPAAGFHRRAQARRGRQDHAADRLAPITCRS